MENTHFGTEPVIFTTGAFLKPTKANIDGKEIWFWAVTEFIDDSFNDGVVYNPNEFSESREELLKEVA